MISKDGNVYIGGKKFAGGIMTFINDEGIGHAVVITGYEEVDGERRITYIDPSAPPDKQIGYRVDEDYFGIYGVGEVGSYSGSSSN